MNNYLKLLLHLKQFEGDGKMHKIEQLFPEINIKEIGSIVKELENEKFIQLTGREPKYDSFFVDFNSMTNETKWTESPLNKLNRQQEENEYKAKITFAGSKYLKEELQMQELGKYNINVSGKGANNTFVIESNNVTIDNRPDFSSKVDKIIDTIKSDESISDELKYKAIEEFKIAKTEVNKSGKLPEKIMKGILQYGAQIGSIGSLLYQLFVTN